MGKRIFLKHIITVILVLIIIFGVIYYIKTISEPQFKMNINLNKEIFFSEERSKAKNSLHGLIIKVGDDR